MTYLNYEGKTLKQYCKEKDICYAAVYSRVVYGDQSIDLAVDKVTKNKGRNDAANKYYYKGVKLTEYFKDRKGYSRCLNYINKFKLSVEDAVKLCEEKKVGVYRTPDGELLQNYALRNKMSYAQLSKYIRKGMSFEEAVEKYKVCCGKKSMSRCKYKIKGISLRSYCLDKELPYERVMHLMNYRGYSIKDAVIRVTKERSGKNDY